MSDDDLIARFAPKVADWFPIQPEETIRAFAARAIAAGLSKGQRAYIAALLNEASQELETELRQRKVAWVSAARLTFEPGPREPCVICGKYKGLTEAHHIVPLGVQFDAGAPEPIQESAWLCPTHHAAEHVFIRNLLRNVSRSIEGLPPDESDALHRFGVLFVDLLITLPHWRRVKK